MTPLPGMAELREAVQHELSWQAALWQSDFLSALASAESVLGNLKSPELRGYRAVWHYLAGSAAWLSAKNGHPALEQKAREHFAAAKAAASGLEWLVALSQFQPTSSEEAATDPAALEQVERLEAVLEALGTLHEGNFVEKEKAILEGLDQKDRFEHPSHRTS